MQSVQEVAHLMYLQPQIRSVGKWHEFFQDIIHPADQPNALYSWRLLIYGDYEDYKPGEPWNSPANRQWVKSISQYIPRLVQPNPPNTFAQIFALTGPGTAFTEYARGENRNFYDCEPGAILLIDHQNAAIDWMEPGDIDVSELMASKWNSGIGNFQPNDREGFFVAFADGEVRVIRKNIPRDTISRFLTIESAKSYDRETELAAFTIDKLPPLPLQDMRNKYEDIRDSHYSRYPEGNDQAESPKR